MPEVLIGRVGWDHLRIAVPDRGSSNWFNADVEIHCGAWHGQYTAYFENGELRSFAAQLRNLYRDLSGSAVFQQRLEAYLTITCKGDGRGHILLSGIAQERPNQGPTLSFQLDLEQTQVPQIADALDAVDPSSPR
jgi:hypothetical protein